MTKPAYVCWVEIPVRDLEKARDFYQTVFQWNMAVQDGGPNPMINFSSDTNAVSGHIYPGKPAHEGNGPTIHLIVPDSLEAAIDRCKTAGGEIISPAIEIPPGRFAYAIDPDGNSIGLFEPKA